MFRLVFILSTFNVLLDTGAFSNALPNKVSNLILKNKETNNILKSSKVFLESLKVADGRIICVERCVQVQLTIGYFQFTEEFLSLKNKFSTLLGLLFFRKNNIVIYLFKVLLYLPNLTISLATKYDRKLSKSNVLHTVSIITIRPNQQEITKCQLINPGKAHEYAPGLIEPSFQFESKSGFCIMSSLSRLDGKCRSYVGIMNLNLNKITITAKTKAAKIEVLSSKQASIHPLLCNQVKNNEHNYIYPKPAQNLRKGISRKIKLVSISATFSMAFVLHFRQLLKLCFGMIQGERSI